ncbi:astacin-like metalloprotease toxin 5 [Argiope bruennichi]|uniref:astacin-like metalloprotease toxin 5 n=1 Tax=Argiope bruennichi TaxID=94029 RepID=UPI002494439A|nr:astacin-like metalloprotease toxin 5 [Argiope bruennichi]
MVNLDMVFSRIFTGRLTEGPSGYPREVLETWGLTTWSHEAGKPKPWEPQTPAERLIAEKALHNKNRYGGDMKFVRRQLVGNSISFKDMYWPNKTVPYAIDKSIPSKYHNVIERAVEQYHKLTCLNFVKRTNQKDYIKFEKIRNEDGCWSYVGYSKTGAQTINLDEGCYYIGTIVHEIGHAIGFWHEHQRHDRDKYLTINTKNIMQGLQDQFTLTKPQDEIIYSNFDYNSIMIYGNYAFSTDLWNLKTIEAKDKRELTEPFNKPGLDNSDIQRVECMYCKTCKEIKP